MVTQPLEICPSISCICHAMTFWLWPLYMYIARGGKEGVGTYDHKSDPYKLLNQVYCVLKLKTNVAVHARWLYCCLSINECTFAGFISTFRNTQFGMTLLNYLFLYCFAGFVLVGLWNLNLFVLIQIDLSYKTVFSLQVKSRGFREGYRYPNIKTM